MAIVFLCANNSILMSVPPEYSGVVGGIFNACLQLGAVAGLAMLGTIKLSFQDHSSGSSGHHAIEWAGYRASFIFMAGCCVAIAVVAAIWFKNPLAGVVKQEKEVVHEQGLEAQSV
jgi:MFS family permease